MTDPNIKFIVIDSFCGAGGVTEGFHRAEINGHKIAKVIIGINHDAMAIASHAANTRNRRTGILKYILLMKKNFLSTELIDQIHWNGFAWFGEVLIANKNDMQKQFVINASGTGCVTDGKKDLNLKLERSSFPDVEGFNIDDYEIIGFWTKNERNLL